jgi:hypothetical protein
MFDTRLSVVEWSNGAARIEMTGGFNADYRGAVIGEDAWLPVRPSPR